MELLSRIIICLLLMHLTTAKEFTYTRTNASLPFAVDNVGAVFDGDDSIYIFGGVLGHPYRMIDLILRYSISSESISFVAHLPKPAAFQSNTVAMNSEKKIIAFSSYNGASEVYKFDPISHSVKIVGSLKFSHTPLLQTSKDKGIFITSVIDDFANSVVEIDLKTLEVKILYGPILPRHFITFYGAYDKQNNVTYSAGKLYDYNQSEPHSTKFNHTTGLLETITTNLMTYNIPSGAVWKDGKMFIIDDMGKYETILSVFDPECGTIEPVFVHGTNAPAELMWHRTIVYVEKLNRIYLFGGSEDGLEPRNDVGYLELGSVSSVCVK